MSLEETICLIIEVKNMTLRIEEPGHVLVSDGQSRVIGLQTSNNPKEALTNTGVNNGCLTQRWAHSERA